eukprot:TRINITY_DN1884_c1_g1_i3.p1 TRINITY_DN1884_c1_g1~~TRINITY_DN1884_c1_g1_i3.p1  ORF type:complete len:112 (-),score=0.23 TRINITY_DN1884_c1_g1_i3:12-347(-)
MKFAPVATAETKKSLFFYNEIDVCQRLKLQFCEEHKIKGGKKRKEKKRKGKKGGRNNANKACFRWVQVTKFVCRSRSATHNVSSLLFFFFFFFQCLPFFVSSEAKIESREI